MMMSLELVIAVVTFGAVCNCKSAADIHDLPQNVQSALHLLSNNGLMSIGDAAASSPHIFEQIVGYWTTNWKDTHCEWLNDELPESTTNQWKYMPSTDVITGPLVTWCDIEETFNPLYLSDIDAHKVPQHLYDEIAFLLSPEADGNQCLARLKYYVWTLYGIEWNEAFVGALGFHSDMELFMTIGDQLYGLIHSEQTPQVFADALEANKRGKREKDEGSNQNEGTEQNECHLLEPALLVEPVFEPITDIYEKLFSELEGTTISATASFGVRLCYEYNAGLCFGGGFGFAVNAQRQGFLYRESILDVVPHIDFEKMELAMNARGAKQEPMPTDYPSSTESTQMAPSDVHSTVATQTTKHSEPQSTESTQMAYPEPEPTIHSTETSKYEEPHSTEHYSVPSEPYSTESTQMAHPDPTVYSTETTKHSVEDPSTSSNQEPHSTEHYPVEPHPTESTHQSEPQPTESTHMEPSAVHATETSKYSEPMPSNYPEPHSTEHYPNPSQDPHSTESTQMAHPEPEPTMHSTETSKYEEPHSTESTSAHQEPHSTMHSEPYPEPSEPHATQSTSMAHPEPTQIKEPRMHATFYIEFSLYDDIDAIHSTELMREINENLSGIWIVDPAVIYDEGGNAVGVTFSAEVDMNGQLAPGFPVGAIVLDKVAELVSDDGGRGHGEVFQFARRASIIEAKKGIAVDEYYPMMMVCAAIGVTIVFAAKLYSKQFGRKEYEPLLG